MLASQSKSRQVLVVVTAADDSVRSYATLQAAS